MKYSIVTPVHNQSAYTKQYLDCLKSLPSDLFEVIVISNGSTDQTEDLLKEYSQIMNGKDGPKLTYQIHEDILGFAKASNLGYSVSVGDVIIFLNNDIKTKTNEWYKPLEPYLNKDMLIGPTGGFVDPKTYDFKYETNDSKNKTNYISGWCLVGNRNTFENIKNNTPGNPVGPFIEKFITYFEDTYMGFLASKMGIKQLVIFCPDILHFGRVTTRKMNLSRLYISAKEKFIKEIEKLNKKAK